MFKMKRRRRFYDGVMNHVYQRTVGGVHLFYTIEDCLVFLSILSVCVRSSNVKILELTLMHNHIHMLLVADSFKELSSFMDRCTSWFVRAYNIEHGRKGRLLKKNFGSAPKWDGKKQRSAIIYIGNNPVEKNFCRYAEDCRWTFLAYAKSRCPFSDPIVIKRASSNLKSALQAVDNMIELNVPLKYSSLAFYKSRLSDQEYNQLVDYIISGYLPLDFEELLSRFKSYEDMIVAMHSTTGSEYDLNEDMDDFSLTSFHEIMNFLKNNYSNGYIRKMISMSLDEKFELASVLRKHTRASSSQIIKFLHIPVVDRRMEVLDNQ